MNESGYNKLCMTVVIPVYNRQILINRCLDSIFMQTYRPLHVIVVDNASSDATAENVANWAATHKDPHFSLELLSESRRNASYARQTGLDHTDTEKVMFFDSDDSMRPDEVERVMKAWEENPEVDVVAWPMVVHGSKGSRLTHSINGNLLEKHMVHAIFRTQGYAVKTDYIRKCGGWKGEFSCWDDLETGVRLLLRSPKVKALSLPLADVYPQVESISGVSFSEKVGRWEMALDGIDKSISSSVKNNKDRLHDIVSYRRAILAADYYKEGHPELAEPLYKQALSEVSRKKRPFIRFAYHWTKSGLRGAFYIVGKFL